MSNSVKPKWKEGSAVRRGTEAHHLAVMHREVLEPRLAAGTIDALSADLALLGASDADRQATKTAQKGRTGTERELASDAKDWVIAVRDMAKRTPGIGEGALKALGVGEKVSPSNTNQVVGAVNACLRAFEADPALAPSIGLVEADVAEAAEIVTSLVDADALQTDVMTARKDKTFDRNAVQLRVEAAVDMISSRGAMAFRADKDLRARFSDLVSNTGPASSNQPPAAASGDE